MKLTIIILIAVLILLLLFFVATDWLVRYAYDRTCPELPKFISQGVMGKKVKTKNGKSVSRQRAEELREKANIKYEMTTFDDVKLVAHYYPAENAKRVIICCHGWHSSWDYDFNGPADFLHDSGSSLLLVELRAHGESGGRYVYYGKKERYDIALWSNFVAKSINDKLPIYIYGMSIGAMSSIMSTASGLNKNVVGIIADSAPSDARNLGHTVISNLHINPKFIYPVIRLDSKIRIKMDDNEYTAFDALQKNKLPILFVHGTKDRVADIKYMQKMYSLCSSPKAQLVVEGAGHMKSYYVDTDKYQSKLTDFINYCEK